MADAKRRGTLYAIGERHSFEAAPGSVDAGIIRVPASSHWPTSAGYGRVVVTRSADTTRDELYQINGESFASLGQMLCMTGSRPLSGSTDFTRCGSVTELNYTANYPAGDMHGLRVLNICGTMDGHSGAPYYIGRRAYGIHSGSGDGCRAYMMDIQRAEDAMNVDLLHG